MYVACWRFSKIYDSILQGTFEYDMFYDNNHSLTVRLLKKAMSEFVFDSRVITEPEISAQIILDFLLDRFVPALVRFDNYGIMTAQDKKIITLLSSIILMTILRQRKLTVLQMKQNFYIEEY